MQNAFMLLFCSAVKDARIFTLKKKKNLKKGVYKLQANHR